MSKAVSGRNPKGGRPRSDKEPVTIWLSPEVLQAVRGEMATKLQDPATKRSEATIGATIEALLRAALDL